MKDKTHIASRRCRRSIVRYVCFKARSIRSFHCESIVVVVVVVVVVIFLQQTLNIEMKMLFFSMIFNLKFNSMKTKKDEQKFDQ